MKRIISLLLSLAAAWAVGELFSLGFDLPPALWTAAVLAAEVEIIRRRLGAKAVCGGVFCVSLAFALAYGLASAVSHLFSGGFTSFPWYSGFAFAGLTVGPVTVLAGVAWMVLHLRQHPGNVRDIRLLTLLLLIGTGAWAILWTADRLIHADRYSYPWHTAFFFAALYFGPWLLAEGVALALLKRREKNLPPAEPVPAPAPQPAVPIPWLRMVLPAAAVLLAVWLLDPGHPVQNGLTAAGNALTACLALTLSALILERPAPVGITMALTALAAVGWGVWYAAETGLPAGSVCCLALGFFGPFLAGLLVERRGRGSLGAAAVTVVLLAACLSRTAWVQDIPASVGGVTAPEPGVLRLSIRADAEVDGIFDWERRQEGDALYLTYSTRWTPFARIGPFHLYDNIRPDDGLTRIYIYRSPGVYDLALVRDPQTGQWHTL